MSGTLKIKVASTGPGTWNWNVNSKCPTLQGLS